MIHSSIESFVPKNRGNRVFLSMARGSYKSQTCVQFEWPWIREVGSIVALGKTWHLKQP